MNLFQLILKQMRQRLLSTVLTCLSIVLGMSLITSILVLEREGREVFSQRDYGCNLLVGPKGSELQLVLNTLYHVGNAPGTIPYRQYEELIGKPHADGSASPMLGMVRWAVPIAVGDSYRNRRIVATTPQIFGVDDAGKLLPEESRPMYRRGRNYEFSAGRAFAPNRFEAVVGSQVAQDLQLGLGKTFRAAHGLPGGTGRPEEHEEEWTIVGILKETHTSNDNVLFIPIISFYAITEHEEGLEAIANIQQTQPATTTTAPATTTATSTAPQEEHDEHEKAYSLNPDGTIDLHLPRDEWRVSAVLVQSHPGQTALRIPFLLRNRPDAIAVQPAVVMGDFFKNFLPATTAMLLLISALVSVVAAISILVSIYNSITARHRDIAIMRALAPTRRRILAAICLEAGMIGLIGGVLGNVVGHLCAGLGSAYLENRLGTGIGWWHADWTEAASLLIILILSLLAGLYPAWKAYQISVAENLANS